MTLPRPEPPPEVIALATERSAARAARDWPRADALREQIEAAGWKVVDRGLEVDLEPATPPTIEIDGNVRYGAAVAVPSVLGDPPDREVTVLVVVGDGAEGLARLLAGLRSHAAAATQVVVVADAPSTATAARLAPGSPDLDPIAGEAPEVAWTSVRLGRAAATNVGLRRARGAVVVLAGTSAEPRGEVLAPLVETLAYPTVAVAGPFGRSGADLRRLVPSDGPDVVTVDADWLAFRRADFEALGPVDEKLATDDHLGAWWSLVLRAGGDAAGPPRRAIRLELPLVRHPAGAEAPDADAERRARRSFYRILDRFRGRPDLLSTPPAET